MPDCELMVFLKNKFRRSYSQDSEIAYRLIDDYHYWFAQYAYRGAVQVLACKFG